MRAIVALTLALSLFAVPALCRDNFSSGNWVGAAYPEGTGPFVHCTMYANYKSGVGMFFTVDRNYNFKMGFASANWALRIGDQYDISYRIDGSRPILGKATAVTEKGVSVDLPDTVASFDQFKKGYVLAVDAVGSQFRFELQGTYAALTQLLACAYRNIETAAGETASRATNPFMRELAHRAQPRLPEQPATASAEARVTAVAFIANLLNRAGLSQYEILTGTDIPKTLNKFDVVWKGPDAYGMLNIVSPGRYSTVDQLASDVIAQDSNACKGAFATGSQSVPMNDGVAMRQLFTACEGTQKAYLVYTLVPLKTGGFYNIMHIANGERRQIDSANSQLAKALPAVMQSR